MICKNCGEKCEKLFGNQGYRCPLCYSEYDEKGELKNE